MLEIRIDLKKVIFVKNAIPGQKVLARITKKKTSYLEARKLDVINESKDFIKPICDHFNDCGGCSFQNLSYEKQLYYKEKQVNDRKKRQKGKQELRKKQKEKMKKKTKKIRKKEKITFF